MNIYDTARRIIVTFSLKIMLSTIKYLLLQAKCNSREIKTRLVHSQFIR